MPPHNATQHRAPSLPSPPPSPLFTHLAVQDVQLVGQDLGLVLHLGDGLVGGLGGGKGGGERGGEGERGKGGEGERGSG